MNEFLFRKLGPEEFDGVLAELGCDRLITVRGCYLLGSNVDRLYFKNSITVYIGFEDRAFIISYNNTKLIVQRIFQKDGGVKYSTEVYKKKTYDGFFVGVFMETTFASYSLEVFEREILDAYDYEMFNFNKTNRTAIEGVFRDAFENFKLSCL